MDEFLGLAFEDAVDELEDIIARLESGDLSLEESVTLYKRGLGLMRYCQGMLDQAELSIKRLDSDDKG